MTYKFLSKVVKGIEILVSSARAYGYFLVPKLCFRKLGTRCQFKEFPRFGYAFRDITIGSRCTFGKGIYLNCGPDSEISIGDNVGLNDYTLLSAIHGITIGSNTRIGEFVSIRDNDHEFADVGTPICQQGFVGASINIEEDVWIGRGVFIGKGVRIGRGAVIGANSVVVKDIPDYAVAVGAPARIIRYRTQISLTSQPDVLGEVVSDKTYSGGRSQSCSNQVA